MTNYALTLNDAYKAKIPADNVSNFVMNDIIKTLNLEGKALIYITNVTAEGAYINIENIGRNRCTKNYLKRQLDFMGNVSKIE